ncbi:hypothetical protein [Burkholderia anthina]|uniref:hypothetical protein n=1 Tax=Burkholderia anthina TaxID=179879 RepID=UPI00292EF7EE|nr:hypothetical protein [Burkholderia anthina]WJN74417.1 hypothetical protein OH687_29330 [Burkholderia anthina]
MSRYPYTEAYDFVRSRVTDFDAEIGARVPKISRSDVAIACNAIADALGMTAEELAKKIADYARALDGRTPASEGEQK